MTAFAVSQILVGAAFVFALIAFQFRRREHVLVCWIVLTALSAVHFLLLNARTAALLTSIASVRYFIVIFRQSNGLLYAFLVVAAASTAATYAGPMSLLAGTASVLHTIASFRGNRGLRQINMLASCVWIVHNTLAGSPAAVMLDVFFLSSNIVGYYRYFWRQGADVTGE